MTSFSDLDFKNMCDLNFFALECAYKTEFINYLMYQTFDLTIMQFYLLCVYTCYVYIYDLVL